MATVTMDSEEYLSLVDTMKRCVLLEEQLFNLCKINFESDLHEIEESNVSKYTGGACSMESSAVQQLLSKDTTSELISYAVNQLLQFAYSDPASAEYKLFEHYCKNGIHYYTVGEHLTCWSTTDGVDLLTVNKELQRVWSELWSKLQPEL